MGNLNLFGKKKNYEPAEIYLRLRDQVFSLSSVPVPSLLKDSSLLAVLMESGYKEAIMTLVTVADGTVSLYFSNGGGMIGLGEHEQVRRVSLDFLSFANEYIPKATLSIDHPFPKQGNVIFYFITQNGISFSTAKESDLASNHSPFSPLFFKAQDVITQARLVDEKRQNDFQELMQAITTGNMAKTSDLIHKLSNPDISDPTGLTPLMAGAYRGQDQTIQMLLDRGVVVDQKDSEGYTALMFACNAGKLACVKLLIEHGASVNEKDKDNSTPIMFAAQHGFNDVVRYLIGKGANPTFVGKHGLSAIDFARQNHLVDTERILLGKE